MSAVSTTPQILLATNNPHKLEELRAIFTGLPVELVTPAARGLALEVEETGSTLEENAILKARVYADAAGLPALADDSGLEINALDGAPGVHSRRFAGPNATDAGRIRLVLERLRDVPWEQRTARFRCVIALAEPGRLVGTVEGICEGLITYEPRGQGGFGYDPIFWLPDRGCTMAELSAAEKNRISHRARAGEAARRLIAWWLGGE